MDQVAQETAAGGRPPIKMTRQGRVLDGVNCVERALLALVVRPQGVVLHVVLLQNTVPLVLPERPAGLPNNGPGFKVPKPLVLQKMSRLGHTRRLLLARLRSRLLVGTLVVKLRSQKQAVQLTHHLLVGLHLAAEDGEDAAAVRGVRKIAAFGPGAGRVGVEALPLHAHPGNHAAVGPGDVSKQKLPLAVRKVHVVRHRVVQRRKALVLLVPAQGLPRALLFLTVAQVESHLAQRGVTLEIGHQHEANKGAVVRTAVRLAPKATKRAVLQGVVAYTVSTLELLPVLLHDALQPVVYGCILVEGGTRQVVNVARHQVL
mmetsp:Transcript_46711/g.86967  ORF Transcript_46711/g.86967 Transcript_46711/m.86967 type:complete len:317 (-) Transcript_46711:813-1763(-)